VNAPQQTITANSPAGPLPDPAAHNEGAIPGFTPSEFRLLLIGLIITLFLSALDNTIVGTAMPTIVGEFGGLSRFTWVTTAYIVTSTISTLVLGKLSDLFGRRRVYLITIVAFLAASVLCGLAQDMNQLIAFRALQGIGGGGILSLTFAVVGDIVPMRERGKYFGLFTGVFAMASVAGPLGGGLIVDRFSWRWIFYVNLPLGALAITMVIKTLHLRHQPREVRLDWAGTGLVACAICALMIPLEIGGNEGWMSTWVLLSFALAVVFTIAFIMRERVAPEPLLPLHFFQNDILRMSMLLGLLTGTVMMSGGLFLSMYFQFVKGMTPTRAGLTTLPIMIGLTIASTITGRLISKWGVYKRFPLIGLPVMLLGMIVCTTVTSSTPAAVLAFGMLLIGFGTGTTMPTISISQQNAAEPRDLGIATSTGNFFRNLGSAIGLAVLGSTFNAIARRDLEAAIPASERAGDVLRIIRQPDRVNAMAPATRAAIHDAISSGVARVFVFSSVVVVLCFIVATRLREEPLRMKSSAEMRATAATE
jgi:EmrB/QacA subfamily drug resistance transporter